MITERYRLTLTHDIIDGNKTIRVEDPRMFDVHVCDMDNVSVYSNRSEIIDNLFFRFLRELKENTL